MLKSSATVDGLLKEVDRWIELYNHRADLTQKEPYFQYVGEYFGEYFV